MYHDKTPPAPRRLVLRGLAILLAAGLLLTSALWAMARVDRDLSGQGAQTLRNTVLRAAVQCYAVEGSYPEDLDYLTQNYGLRINDSRYLVVYEAFAANQMPQVTVLER